MRGITSSSGPWHSSIHEYGEHPKTTYIKINAQKEAIHPLPPATGLSSSSSYSEDTIIAQNIFALKRGRQDCDVMRDNGYHYLFWCVNAMIYPLIYLVQKHTSNSDGKKGTVGCKNRAEAYKGHMDILHEIKYKSIIESLRDYLIIYLYYDEILLYITINHV